MTAEQLTVFFYGLFMDRSLLASKGISPSRVADGYVDAYALRIGSRATLVPDAGSRAYGVLMTIRAEDANALYSDESVADYVPESVSVTLPDGTVESAVCYNLPQDKLAGANARYANALLTLARDLGFPEDYLRQIEAQGARD